MANQSNSRWTVVVAAVVAIFVIYRCAPGRRASPAREEAPPQRVEMPSARARALASVPAKVTPAPVPVKNPEAAVRPGVTDQAAASPVLASVDVEPSAVVRVVLQYVEIKTEFSQRLAVNWAPDLGNGPGGRVHPITGTVSNLMPKLNWGKQHGLMRILGGASVRVENDRPVNITAMAPLPQRISDLANHATGKVEEAGIRATIIPSISGQHSESIKLAFKFLVKTVVSDADDGPRTAEREVQDFVRLNRGETAVVGGLIQTLPTLSRLPADALTNPLKMLYRSRDFRAGRSIFLVFVSPVVVDLPER